MRKTEDIVDKEEGCQDLVRLCIMLATSTASRSSQQSRALMHRLYRLCHTFLRYAMPRTGMAASQPVATMLLEAAP